MTKVPRKKANPKIKAVPSAPKPVADVKVSMHPVDVETATRSSNEDLSYSHYEPSDAFNVWPLVWFLGAIAAFGIMFWYFR